VRSPLRSRGIAKSGLGDGGGLSETSPECRNGAGLMITYNLDRPAEFWRYSGPDLAIRVERFRPVPECQNGAGLMITYNLEPAAEF